MQSYKLITFLLFITLISCYEFRPTVCIKADNQCAEIGQNVCYHNLNFSYKVICENNKYLLSYPTCFCYIYENNECNGEYYREILSTIENGNFLTEFIHNSTNSLSCLKNNITDKLGVINTLYDSFHFTGQVLLAYVIIDIIYTLLLLFLAIMLCILLKDY